MTKPMIHLDHLDPGEDVLLVLRRHGMTFVSHLVLFFAFVFLPILATIFFAEPFSAILTERSTAGALIVMAASLYYLFLGLRLYHAWLVYYLDSWVVTTKRLISINQHSLFSREVAEMPIAHVQDVAVEVKGVLPTMLHFGDVIIQTAGEFPHFRFDDVPRPYDICKIILEAHHRALQEYQANTMTGIPHRMVGGSPNVPPSQK